MIIHIIDRNMQLPGCKLLVVYFKTMPCCKFTTSIVKSIVILLVKYKPRCEDV